MIERTLDELTARDAGDPRAAQVVLLTAGLPLAARNPDAEPDTSAPVGTEAEDAS